jgi:polyhydroxyalkanoate synthesis regulator phasin
MTEPAFSPEMNEALNAYVVPPVPTGFSEGLMARIASGDTGSVESVAMLPSPRRRAVSPWRRTSRIIGSLALFSLATATAAAAGVFGRPVYVPGVSEALIEAKIVEAPAPASKPKVRMVAEPKAVTPAAAPQPATGSAAIVSRVTELRSDPEYIKLPPRERLRVAGKEVREMVRSGEASRQDVRAAVRELVEDADPATKEAWRKAAADRREKRLERRESLRNAPPEERAAMVQALHERRQARLNETPPE